MSARSALSPLRAWAISARRRSSRGLPAVDLHGGLDEVAPHRRRPQPEQLARRRDAVEAAHERRARTAPSTGTGAGTHRRRAGPACASPCAATLRSARRRRARPRAGRGRCRGRGTRRTVRRAPCSRLGELRLTDATTARALASASGQQKPITAWPIQPSSKPATTFSVAGAGRPRRAAHAHAVAAEVVEARSCPCRARRPARSSACGSCTSYSSCWRSVWKLMRPPVPGALVITRAAVFADLGDRVADVREVGHALPGAGRAEIAARALARAFEQMADRHALREAVPAGCVGGSAASRTRAPSDRGTAPRRRRGRSARCRRRAPAPARSARRRGRRWRTPAARARRRCRRRCPGAPASRRRRAARRCGRAANRRSTTAMRACQPLRRERGDQRVARAVADSGRRR